MPNYMDDDQERDLSWKKPDWASGVKLKKTGKADVMKTEGNLAAPITSLPHQKADGPFQKPEWTGDVKDQPRPEGKIEKPITELPHSGDKNLAFEKPEWTKNAGLAATGKGEALKSGKEIARPIGGIKPVDES